MNHTTVELNCSYL